MSSESLSTKEVEVEPGRPDSWNVFAGAHRWWLRNGVPPTLGPAATRVRVIRTSLLLAVMGIVSSWLSFAAAYGLYRGTDGLSMLVLFGPGLAYGIVVLVPLSRWLGRNWFWSVSSVFPSCVLNGVAILLFLFISPISVFPNGLAFSPPVGSFWAGLLGGLGIGLWMECPLRWSMLRLPIACGLAAGICCSIATLDFAPINVGVFGQWLHDARRFLNLPAAYGSFQIPVAVLLGIRLWDRSTD